MLVVIVFVFCSNQSQVGMCLKENYSDSPSNEYSRHFSAESESEYLRRQNMNSKLGEEKKKKKGHHVRRSPNFDPNSDKKQKKGQNDNGLILGRVTNNSRGVPQGCLITRPSTRHIPSRKQHPLTTIKLEPALYHVI